MATRSFPVQYIRGRIEGILDNVHEYGKICTTFDSHVSKDIYVALGKAFRLPMETGRQHHDVIDHLHRTIERMENVVELVTLHTGATEATLDSQDMADLSFLQAYTKAVRDVKVEQDANRTGG